MLIKPHLTAKNKKAQAKIRRFIMGRRGGIMSDQLKEEIAKELGFYDTVQQEGWGGIRARDAGNMVKRAIEMAQNQMVNRQKN